MANGIANVGHGLELDDLDEENMAHHAPHLDVLTGEECERIARVAYRISQIEQRRARKVLPVGTVLKPWREMTARERTEACATVLRVVQSMTLLGWLENP